MLPLRIFFFLLLIPCFSRAEFRAGAFAVDIGPQEFPVRVNAMFTERSADKVADPLAAKALALDDGTTRVILCVVDTCMIPRDLIDRAKSEASKVTGVPIEKMLVSSTHSHSAPSAMGCLGSRSDPGYVRYLPGRITAALVGAIERLAPARIGWAQADDPEHTFNRRWIRRPDRMLNDPFGVQNVRANMHPGHESADVTGPSGPVDPQLSVVAVKSPDGKPLAVFANYSMHYYGSPLLSSDYYGEFGREIATMLGGDAGFVGIMSQGTSGDLMWMDYSAPRHEVGYKAYAHAMAERVRELIQGIKWKAEAPLKMAERTLQLAYRVPDEKRLAWARDLAAKFGDGLPETQPEIYALEAIQLHERQRTELKLQALRIGDLGVTAIPNEVFAITGLKLKRQSPLPQTMNVELANGAEGYIPPPEQHVLGGYTTWPARTAGLEPQAEPRIVETILSLLEEVAGKPRRPLVDSPTPYSRAVLDAKPLAYWRLADISVPVARDALGQHDAAFEDGVALYLSGLAGGHAAHFAGGRVRTTLPLGENYSVSFWLWNALPYDARAVTGYAFSRGPDGNKKAPGEHLGIGGTFRGDLAGKLILFNGNERDQVLAGRTTLALRAWHHVAFVREGGKVRVHLDGRAEPEIAGELAHTVPAAEETVFLGGRSDGLFGFEGKLAEVAIFPRALTPAEINTLHQASGEMPPVAAAPPIATDTTPSAPLSPIASLAKIHIRAGYGVELVASEPLTMDPVAIDWSPDGRLWVVEMADYPLGMDGKGAPGGRVRVLEDTDGDGSYDKSTLFADGLTFPTGLLTWRDGVIVTAAPDIFFLRDADGDGKADMREVLVTGLTTGNQQLRANGLRWGLDGWVYCAAGGHHGEYGVGTKLRTKADEVLVGSRDFRFHPDTGELEPQSGPSQFGRNRDDYGHWFGTQNSRPLWHYVLPDHYLRRNPHIAAPDPRQQVVVPLNPKVWPVSPQEKRYHSFNEGGHFTSACSGMIYRDDFLFGRGLEMHAFTCEPFHNLVQHNLVTDSGVTFTARRAPGEERSEFFSSEDRWCRPVMTRTGPDGSLWVVDMYRYMIEHPEWLPKEGRAELLPHYRLGDDRGRIYRVFPIGVTPRKVTPLDRLSTAELVAALDSPNEWQRDKAHMLLTWRPDTAALPLLEKMVAESANPLARLHALCLAETPSAVLRALGDSEPGVRENALRIAEKHGTREIIAAAAKLADDPSAKVRLQLALSLGEWKDPAAGEALARLAVRDSQDPFIAAAVMSSSMPHATVLSESIAKCGGEPLRVFGAPLAKLCKALGQPATEPTARPLETQPSGPSPVFDRAEVMKRFQPALKLSGNPANGREVFNQLCASAIATAIRGMRSDRTSSPSPGIHPKNCS
jgi:putative membrane-bound dehydrogenase-like protein